MLQIDSPELAKLLLSGSFGLEKESLRTDEAGFLSHTPHPFMDNPNIVRDFCENQTEINTSVQPSPHAVVAELERHTRTIQKTLGCFDSITQGDGYTSGNTVMDIGFSNVNPVLHCPGTLLGVGVMENWGRIFGGNDKYTYSIYSHAYCESIAEVQYAFYQEEVALAEKMGVGIQYFPKKNFLSRASILGPEYMGDDCIVPFDEQWPTGYGTGPFTIKNRYITEDVPVGCHIYHELCKKYGVPTPVIDSMITLGSVMTGQDYYKSGLTLDDLGIGELDGEQLLTYLNEGILA
ncbi:MAG: NAD/NADP octopine/nopaline dehydrogenase family protein [Lachnospiraceae bacterium]|nr:NAD/NADP octopine/nopaline dehydrogenase family protein [Lachnospiraceae bacterium]